jgi:hypothetical protein
MERVRLAAGLFALTLVAPQAIAADYPFSGYFTSQEIDMPPDEVQLACAFGFFRQDKDGSFIGYLIDRDGYKADRTLRYHEYGRGKCVIDETGQVETCTMTDSPDKAEIGQSYYDVMGARTADTVVTAIFDTFAAAGLYATVGAGTPTAELRISRCMGFDDARLAPYLTTGITKLPIDARGELLSPVVDGDNRPAMTEIIKKITGNN